jgi:hypothetical protein
LVAVCPRPSLRLSPLLLLLLALRRRLLPAPRRQRAVARNRLSSRASLLRLVWPTYVSALLSLHETHSCMHAQALTKGTGSGRGSATLTSAAPSANNTPATTTSGTTATTSATTTSTMISTTSTGSGRGRALVGGVPVLKVVAGGPVVATNAAVAPTARAGDWRGAQVRTGTCLLTFRVVCC